MESRSANVRSFLYSLGLHVLCIALAFSGMFWWQSSKPLNAAGDPMEAVFVDLGSLQPVSAPPRPRPPQPDRAPPPKPEPPRPPPTDQSAQDLIEQQRIDRMAQLRADQEQAEQEERRKREEQILLEEEQRREAEQRERERREQQQREQREREAREQAEREAKEAADREREKAEREAAAQAEREAAQRQAGTGGTDDSLAARYAAAIQNKVQGHWQRPEHVRTVRCQIRIVQIPGGEVISAEVVGNNCNADELTRRSIEAAVLRAQPLPYEGFESVFRRSVLFTFRFGEQ